MEMVDIACVGKAVTSLYCRFVSIRLIEVYLRRELTKACSASSICVADPHPLPDAAHGYATSSRL